MLIIIRKDPINLLVATTSDIYTANKKNRHIQGAAHDEVATLDDNNYRQTTS